MKRDLSGLDAKGLQDFLQRNFEKPQGSAGAQVIAEVRERGQFVVAEPPKPLWKRVFSR